MELSLRDACIRVQEEAKLEATTFRIDDVVKAACAERYIYDWSMYVACAKNGMNAKLPESDKPDRPKFDIGAKCEEAWPTKKSMQRYCIKNQEKAQAKAGDHRIDSKVAIKCTADYPADWEMFVYCVERYRGSKLGLGR